jgi:hypothetical protein
MTAGLGPPFSFQRGDAAIALEHRERVRSGPGFFSNRAHGPADGVCKSEQSQQKVFGISTP